MDQYKSALFSLTNPLTGDESSIWLYVIFGGLALIGLAVVIFLKIKSNKK